MRRLNFYHLWFAQSTILQALFQAARCSTVTVTYQCVLHVFDGSRSDTVCMTNNKIGCLHWDNDHFDGVTSFPLRRLNDVGNIVGRFRQLSTVIELSGSH